MFNVLEEVLKKPVATRYKALPQRFHGKAEKNHGSPQSGEPAFVYALVRALKTLS